jgi:hypothetical protein
MDAVAHYLLRSLKTRHPTKGATFLLPIRRVARILCTGYEGAAAAIGELAMAGEIVETGRNVRGNIAWKLAEGPPVPIATAPREPVGGRVGTSIAEKAEVVAQALRAEFGDVEFSMPMSIWARRLRTQSETIAAAQRYMVDCGVLEMVKPLGHRGAHGMRSAVFRFSEGRS